MILLSRILLTESLHQTGKLFFRALMSVMFMVSGAMITGCAATNQKNGQLPVSVPEQFSDSGQSSLPEQWWLSFEDPVLNGLIEHALENNFNLKIAWDRLDKANALARKAKADIFPVVNAEGRHTRNFLFEDEKNTRTHNTSVGFATSYEIDLWGRVRSSRDAAAFAAKASVEDLKAAALSLSAQVTGIWYHLVEQYGQLEILNRQISTSEKILEIITLQVRIGKVGNADMLQQQQLIESNHGEKNLVLARARILEHQLAILLGTPPQQKVAPRVTELINLPPLPAIGLPAELIQKRPDIRSSFFRVKKADKDLATAIANRFPRLSITAGVHTSGARASNLFNNWLATLAANLTAPLIDGGLRKAEVEWSHAAESEALHAYGQNILEALGEVENALAQEQRQRDFITSLDRQLKLAEQVLERLQERYVQGNVDYIRVLNALLSLQKLQRSLLSAKQGLIQYRIDLCLALGTGWVQKPQAENDNAGEPELQKHQGKNEGETDGVTKRK